MKAFFIIPAVAAACLACRTDSSTPADTSTRSTTAQNLPASSATATNPELHTSVAIGDLASCQPTSEVSGVVTRWIELADADSNGQISRSEAQSFTNFVIGGFFFRADGDGNGMVSPEEGRAARAQFAAQYPGLASLLKQAGSAAGESPFKAVAQLLDIDYGKPLSADDARAAAKGALDDLFKVADANKDGSITRAEARAASWEGARALGQNMFRSVDANKDGKIDSNEFQRAVDGTAKLAFDTADANDNGSLTEQEAAAALSSIARRIGVPESGR